MKSYDCYHLSVYKPFTGMGPASLDKCLACDRQVGGKSSPAPVICFTCVDLLRTYDFQDLLRSEGIRYRQALWETQGQ